MSSAPTVMVSSTFYDLRQIRADLARFITDDLGYIPLLSEFPSFPVDPDLDTIDNCITRVERNADILVLVIGGRYGSVDANTDKSITNLEFLAAKRKGIPIYAFVEKGILANLPVWKDNPRGDFSAVVDTPRLFDFVESVRTQDRVWTFSFETAQEITTVLRLQLAHLFRESLTLRQRIGGSGLPQYSAFLSPKSLRIALEKPNLWEYRLFFQSWLDELERRADHIKAYKADLAIGRAEHVPASNAYMWLGTRFHELQGFVTSSKRLISESAKEAFGPIGQPGNAEDILWVSRSLGLMLDKILDWAHGLRTARVESPFDRVPRHLALFVDDIIRQFEDFPKTSLQGIEDDLASGTIDSPGPTIMTWTWTFSNQDAYKAAIEEANRQYVSDIT